MTSAAMRSIVFLLLSSEPPRASILTWELSLWATLVPSQICQINMYLASSSDQDSEELNTYLRITWKKTRITVKIRLQTRRCASS